MPKTNHFDQEHTDTIGNRYFKTGIANHVTTSNDRLDTMVTTVHSTQATSIIIQREVNTLIPQYSSHHRGIIGCNINNALQKIQ